jgi:hypothetical protein
MIDGRFAPLFDGCRQVLNLRVEHAQLPPQFIDAALDVRREQLFEETVDDRAHDGGPQHVARDRLQHGVVDSLDGEHQVVRADRRTTLPIREAAVEVGPTSAVRPADDSD